MQHKLQVTDIASPLFKTDWPGAPRSSQSEERDQFHADFAANEQDKLLERCISLAKTFNTDRIRCFDFWRLDDQKPYQCGDQCQTATGCRTLRERQPYPLARERDVLQHSNRRRVGCLIEGDSNRISC
jgi:hypothetical protein